MVRDHAGDLGQHTIDDIHEIAGDVTPARLPGLRLVLAHQLPRVRNVDGGSAREREPAP